jgi:hypothetical protein
MNKFKIIVVLCALLLGSNSLAGTVNTRLIDLQFWNNTWYDYTGANTGNISFNATPLLNGTLYTSGDAYTLDIDAKFTFTADLKRDVSSSGQARGYFDYDNITVELIGGLKDGGSYVYGGSPGSGNQETIFRAAIAPLAGGSYYEDSSAPTEKRWLFEERQYESKRFDRSHNLVLDNIGLAVGITIGTDTVKLSSPKMDLSLKSSVNPNNFVSEDLSSGFTASNIKVVPEPATIFLLGLSSLFFKRRMRVNN